MRKRFLCCFKTSADKVTVSSGTLLAALRNNDHGWTYSRGAVMLEIGKKAPEFSLPDQNGEKRNLSDDRGRREQII